MNKQTIRNLFATSYIATAKVTNKVMRRVNDKTIKSEFVEASTADFDNNGVYDMLNKFLRGEISKEEYQEFILKHDQLPKIMKAAGKDCIRLGQGLEKIACKMIKASNALIEEGSKICKQDNGPTLDKETEDKMIVGEACKLVIHKKNNLGDQFYDLYFMDECLCKDASSEYEAYNTFNNMMPAYRLMDTLVETYWKGNDKENMVYRLKIIGVEKR